MALWRQFVAYAKKKDLDDIPDLDTDTESGCAVSPEVVSGELESAPTSILAAHLPLLSAEVRRLIGHRLSPRDSAAISGISISYFTQYRYPSQRSLPTSRIASSGANSRAADALLLDSKLLLGPANSSGLISLLLSKQQSLGATTSSRSLLQTSLV